MRISKTIVKYLFLIIFWGGASLAHSQVLPFRPKPLIEIGGGPATGVSNLVYTGFLNVRGGMDYQISERVNLTGTFGYVHFFRHKNKKGVSFLPLSAGADYFMSSKLFVEMQLGTAMLIEDKTLYFILEPGAGWRFDKNHNVRVSYYGFVTNGLIIGGVNLGYRFIF